MAKNVALAAYKAGEKAKKSGKHHRPKMQLPVALIAGFVPLAANGLRDYQQGGLDLLGTGLTWRLTGYNQMSKRFDFSGLSSGLLPILMGIGVHKLANRLGINRALAQAGIPLLRV
jgi:hypothetical protein